MKKSKVERKNVPEFTAPPPNYIERVHTNYSVISEADFKAITELTRYFFCKSFSDYIYAVNFPNDSCLQKIDEYSFAFPLNMIKNSDEKISKKKLSQIISYIYSISFPPSLQVIAENSLGGCRYLNSVTFLKNDKGENFLESICKSAFADTKIEEIVIPENIKEIGSFVFPKFLKSIEFENGAPMLLTVNDYAFSNTQIEKIAMPLNINPFIESKNIFFNCKQLKSIVFDQALNKQEEPENSIIDDEINDSAQSYLLSQTKIENLEVFVSDLSKFYFYNTPNLTSITIPKSNYSKFIKKKGLVYTKNQKKLIVAERNIKSATISSKCAIILNFALNVPSLEKVTFEDNSELQEISCFAFSESQIKKLTLPETVTKISPGCFYKCSKLEKINIPKSIEIIDYVTFSFTNLSSITIPKSVTKIGYGSFYKCQKLCKVLFEEGSNLNEIEALAFSETSLSSILIPKSVNKIGDFCFTNCTLLKSITFEENSVLQYIGEKCFNGTQITDFQLPSSIEYCDFSDTKANKISFPSSCSLLKISNFNSTQITEFVIPSSVEKIGKSAFLRCQNLAIVKVADISNSKLTEIEEKAFLGCNSLKEFELPKTVGYFGSQSFEDCEQFNCKISLETSNLKVCEFAFHNSGVTSFETSSDYISINRFAFKDCKQLKKLILKGLQKVYIQYSSFMDCTSLSTVKITQDLKFASFGDNCFSNTSIKEFDIPNRLVKIPNGCFKNCKKLIRVSFNESIIESFGIEAFYETGLKSIVFPTKITNIGESCFENCKSLKEVTFPEHQYNTIVLCEKSFASSGIEKLYFQDCHLKFQYKCFYNCPDLTSVVLNNSRVLIRKSAFENSNIESFEFLNDKSSKCYNICIPERAFKNCKKLQRLCFSNKCTYFENLSFEGCDNIKEIQFDQLKLVERFCHFWNICDKLIFRFDQQMNNEIIKIFLTNNDPNFVINEKYYFGFPSCRYNELSNIKESISNREIEYRNGGYYYENGKKLFRCNLSTQEFSVSKDTEIIESCAFKFSNLKKIDFEKGSILNTIESNVFEYLQIEEISIPDSVTVISDSAFRDCHNLKAVILNETSQLITIGDSAFEKTAINTILFPPNLRNIGPFAFYECFNLKAIDNRSKEITFGENSFYRTSIEKIDFPSNSTFGSSSFKGCMKLKQLTFLNKPEKLIFNEESFAFSGLEELSLDCDVEINENAFIYCLLLKQVTLKGKSVKLNKSSFNFSKIDSCILNTKIDSAPTLEIIDDVFLSSIEKASFVLKYHDTYSSKLKTEKHFMNHKCYVIDHDLVYANLIDNLSLFEKSPPGKKVQIKKNEVLRVPSNVKSLNFPIMSHIRKIQWPSNCIIEELGVFSYYNLTEITIPKLVTVIPPHCFEHCHYLQVVLFEEDSKLKEIGKYGFAHTIIEKIDLPETVKIIDDYSFYNTHKLKEVAFHGEIISQSAFEQSAITTFNLSNNTTVIGYDAFRFCRSLTQFNIDIDNSNLSEINSNAFEESSITSINIPPEITTLYDNTFKGCQFLKEINFSRKSKLSKIERFAFVGNISLSRIIIPEKLKNVFNEAINNDFNSLNDRFFTIEGNELQPGYVNESQIEKCCFISILNEDENGEQLQFNPDCFVENNCYVVSNELKYAHLIDNSLLYIKPTEQTKGKLRENEVLRVPCNVKKLNFPEMTHIKRVLFGPNCIVEDLGSFRYYNLTEILIPKLVKIIPPHCFEHCHHLKVVQFYKNSKLKEIGEYGFANTKIEQIELPKTVQIIGNYSFFNDHKLKEVIFEGKTIGDFAFAQSGLTKFNLSNKTKTIGNGAFQYCRSLTNFEIDIENSVLSKISQFAFQEAAITEINIPPKVKRINAYAFNGCQFLKEVIISSKSKLSKIKEYSFAGCLSLTNINIPKTIIELNSKALINTPSLLMIMNRPNQYFRVMKNYTVYGKDGSLVFVPRELIKYRVMRNTFTINSGAFCGPCLEKVTFSDNSLIKIEDAAFAHSIALRKVHLPNSIRVIGEDAFIDCQSLERLDFEPITKLKEIPRFCFAFSGLKSIRLPISLEIIRHSSFYMCQNLKNVNLADTNVKYIGDCAFSDANLSEVKLPSSVKFIGSNAFHGNKSMKLVDLTKLDIIVDTNQLPIISFIKQIKQSNRKLLNAIDDFVSTEFEKKMKIEAENKQNNKEKEQIEQKVEDEELNGTKDNSNVSQQSNNVPKISLKMISKKNPVIVKPGVSSSRPTSSRNPSQGRSQTNIINNPIPILPPQEENQSKSPRKINRNQSNTNDNNTNEVVEETIVFEYNDNNEKEDDNNKNKVCFIHEFAFNNSQIKLFNLELDEYKWFSFFDYCARIEQYAINKNIILSLHKLIKEKPKVGNLTGSYFKIKKFDCQDSEETLPMFLGPLTRRRMRTLNPFHFANFTKLTHVTLDDNVIVSEIPKFCFAYSGLKEITIPSSIKIINESAFFSCRLGKIIFSKESKLEEIKEFAFYECRKLSSINIPSSVKSIPKKCFALSGLKSIKLPKNTKTIDYMAFANCNKLAKVVLNKGIEKLGDYSFFSNPLLESIDIPDSLKTIKSYSFSCCTNLKQVNTTENTNLVEIYNGAFENTQIEELFINKNATKLFEPTCVPKLNKIAFYKGQPVNFIQLENGTIFEKTNFSNVQYEEVIQKIKDSFHFPQTQYFIDARNYLIHKSESQLKLIFAPKNLETLKICGNCFSIGKGILDGMVKLTAIEYMEGSTNYVMNFPCYNRLNTGKFNKLKEIKILGNSSLLDERVFSYFNSIEVIEFGEQTNLLYIPKYAFLCCGNLRKIRIPSSCYSIDEGAFKDCTKLEEFEIGIKGSNKSLKYIKKDAFYNCSSLKSIEIPSSVTVIFENAFMNCSKLEKVQINELDCNHGFKIIKKNAFKNCASLTSFNLPKSCLYVGPCCFMNCTSLQTFQYEGYYLSSIECKTFYNCTSLSKFEITKLRNEFYENEEGDDDDGVIKLLYKLDSLERYDAIDDMKKNEENIFYFINFNRFESFNKFGNKRFCIMKEAFMNCTSLKEVTIEDNSKNSSFNLFDENKKLLFKYRKPGTYIYQFIGKKAFYNCESLTKVRLFLANLDLFDESSFENCSSLVEIETNTPYWKLMITENMRKDAFAGTNEKLEIKLFDEGKYTEISTKVDNKKQTKHTQIRYFKDHLSSLNKTKYLFDWSNESKQNQSINKREINKYECLFYSIEKRDYDENEQNKQQLNESKTEQNKQQLSEVKSEQNKQQLSEVKSEQNKQQLNETKSEQNKQKLNETKSEQNKQKLNETVENNKVEYKIDKIKRKRHFKEYLSHLNKEFLAWIIPEKCDKVEKKNAQKTNFHRHKFELYGTSLIYYNGNPGPGAYNIPSCIGNVPPISFHYQYHRCEPLTYSDVYPST